MNLALIGSRCSGKTTVGRILARISGRRFVDTDELIEAAAGKTIHSIVSEAGWGIFRKMETNIISELALGENLVIATGGGSVLDPRNVSSLKEKGLIVWLNAEPEILMRRFAGDEARQRRRPPLIGGNALKELIDVNESRKGIYEAVCDYAFSTEALTPGEIALGILKTIEGSRVPSCQETV